MIFDLLFPPHYAETHYKFRLPWSRLYRRWPEIFLDAPCRVEPGRHSPLVLVLRDADLFPVHVREITLVLRAPDWPEERQTIEIHEDFSQAFHFVPLPLSLNGRKGRLSIDAFIKVRRLGRRGQEITIYNWNYPTVAPVPLEIYALEHPTPKPPDWWAGETHCHTWHSSDPVEFGAPPWLLQQAAYSLGLDYVLCTDHSYDFEFRTDNYRVPAHAEQRWLSFLKELETLPPYPLMIPGEEVSCGNHRGENVHLLIGGYGRHIRGMGDSGRHWFKNHPDQSLSAVLAQVGATPCFAAHPQYPMSRLERLVFRRGDYHDADLGDESGNPIAGLEFWNGIPDEGFRMGRAFWIRQLLRGKKILPIGGNDAHGDLNRFTGVRTPLWSLTSNRARLFGRTRTVIQASQPLLTLPAWQQAIRTAQNTGYAYCTDGPALWWDPLSPTPALRALSTPDFGPVEEIILYRGYTPERGETREPIRCGRWEWAKPIAPNGARYLRAECRTRLGYRALTAALWTCHF